MLAVTLRFPLGVYHALGAAVDADERRAPEWPPSPVRLIGALLDAAHGQPGGADAATLAVISTLAEAGPPDVYAPRASAVPTNEVDVAVLTGPSRWAPRNSAASELKGGLSLRDLAGPRAAVDKGGVAIGDRPVVLAWKAVALSDSELRTLAQAAQDVAWFGTSRSPVLAGVADALPEPLDVPRWEPLRPGALERAEVQLRVPNAHTIGGFDHEFERRRSVKGKIEPSGLQKPATSGVTVGYRVSRDASEVRHHDPRHWGEPYVLEISSESEVQPKGPATYLVARAVRSALLAQFGEPGTPSEAPAILRGRGDTPHAAIVPLPFVGVPHADGSIKGVALLLPHPRRLDGDLTEVDAAVAGLRRLLDAGGEVKLLGRGTMTLRETLPLRAPLKSLDLDRYRGPARIWTTVTPVVHSRWRAAKSRQALVDQIAADCAHVGLPTPERVEVLRNPELPASPPAFVDPRGLRPEWRRSIEGPAQHLRLTFREPVQGPILLGKARHFGLGLMIPSIEGER